MKKIKLKVKHPDFCQLAAAVVEAAADESPEVEETITNPHVAAGRLGGLKGGDARAVKLTSEQRKDIAKIAATARWKKPSED